MTDTPDSLFHRVAAQMDAKLPPVHLWHPRETKDIGLRVTRDGTWWYQGSPIDRKRLVRLFSRILSREGREYFLVTPVEKVRVDVEVAPLLAVRMETRGRGPAAEIAFETNVGDIVVADSEHPIMMRGTDQAPLPLVAVRGGIEALIGRNVYYDLVAQGEILVRGGREVLVVRSAGVVFELGAL